MSGRPPIDDPVLGRLTWNAKYEWYEGELARGGSAVSISLDAGGEPEPAAALRRARAVAAELDRHAAAAQDYAAAELLDLKTENWLDDDEPAVTAEEFRRRMTLESIAFSPDRTVTFYHNDGDLFAGHAIQVVMDEEGRFVDADIPG